MKKPPKNIQLIGEKFKATESGAIARKTGHSKMTTNIAKSDETITRQQSPQSQLTMHLQSWNQVNEVFQYYSA